MNVAERSGMAPAESSGWDDAKSSVALDDLPDGVLVVSAEDGCVEGANWAFLELTGRKQSDVVGRRFETLVAEEDMLNIVGFQAMFGERTTRDNNVIFASPDGHRMSLIVCSIRSRDDRRVIMTARASGTVQEELADVSRWAAAEQERSLELARARDDLTAKNAALSAAQADLEAANTRLKSEALARERLENELRLAQRLESIGELAAGIAHEINTPMQYIGDNVHFLTSAFRSISGYLVAVQAALVESAAPAWPSARSTLVTMQKKLRMHFLVDEVPKALEASQEGIEHVSKIIQAMKSFAHVDHDEKTQSDINRTLEDTLTVAQNEYRGIATVTTELGELPGVLCFAGKLNQVFLNLIVNAAQAIAEARKPSLGSIRVSSRASDGWVEVRIADDGCGVPPAIQHRIFDPFFTTKPVGKGSGQGLSLARSIIVDAHGGSIHFESSVGLGTTFTVRLPVDGGAARAPSLAPAAVAGAEPRA